MTQSCLHLGCMEKGGGIGPPFSGGPVPGTQGGHTREIARDRARLLLVTRSSSMLVSLLLARYYKQKVGNLDRVIMTSTDRGTGCLRIEF